MYRPVFSKSTISIAFLLLSIAFDAQAQALKPPARGAGSLKVVTGHAGSVVFINNVRHGHTTDAGELSLASIKAGTYPVRVRTVGFADWKGSVVIAASASRVLKVTQQPTADQAVLHYQRGDALRDKGKNAEAVKEYEQAIALKPVFPEARIAAARSYIALDEFDKGEAHLFAAMKASRAPLPEAQTVLGNLRRNQGFVDESIVEYRKALRLARNVSPEAHIGLAIALEESNQPEEAIKEYRLGIAQDMDTEPILYYLLANILEKNERKQEAIEAYQSYLRLDPEGQYATAVASIIDRLKEEIDNQ